MGRSTARTAPRELTTGVLSHTQLPPLSSADLLDLYRSSIELRTVLGYIAKRFGSWPMYATLESDTLPLRAADNVIARILKRPNARMSGRACRQLECVYFELLGESIAVLLAPGEDGNDDWAYLPMPPPAVKIQPNGDYVCTIGGRDWTFGEDRVVHIRQLDPCDPYGRGIGVGWAAGDEVQSAENAAKYTASFFYNSARPEHLIMLKEGTPQAARDAGKDFRARYQGVMKAWETAHFVSGEWDVKPLTTSFKDLTMSEVRQYMFDAIRKLWGIPPELVGQLENSNRATISAALEIEARTSLGPRLQLWAEELEYQLISKIPDQEGVVIRFPDPLPKNREHQLEVSKAHPGAFTVNEVRAMADLAPLEGGDVYMRTPDVVWEIEAADVIEVKPLKRKALPPPIPDSVVLLFQPAPQERTFVFGGAA